MMRMKYSSNRDYITSPLFLLGALQIYIVINTKTFTYEVLTTSDDSLFEGQCNSLRMCKTNAKAKLKQLGVVFDSEARSSHG